MSTDSTYQTSRKAVVIQTDLPEEALTGLAEFFERYYLTPGRRYIDQESYKKIESNGTIAFSWKLKLHPEDLHTLLSSNLKMSKSAVEVSFEDLDKNDQRQIALYGRTIDDVQAIVWSYLQHSKLTSLYFVIGSREENHSESPNAGGNTQRSILRRIFSGNMANAFLLFMVISFFLFFIIGVYTVLVMIAFQSVYLFYSDRIILNLGNVRPNAERPLVTIVSVRSTEESLKSLRQHGNKILRELREEVSKTLEKPDANVIGFSIADNVDRIKSSVLAILSQHAIVVSKNDIEIKTKDVYHIVQKIAEKFNRLVPKIVIINSVVSNASATGISTKRSSIMITAGSLEDLTEEELESVIGHELGHVKGHDPAILFAVTSLVFIGYLYYPLLYYLGLFYFILAFGFIFAVGKILETRADTESAITLGKSAEMASALRKIGFRQLYREKYIPLAKLLDWFQFDPHPPMYFRVARMSEFVGARSKTKHTFIISLRDCILGFFRSFY